MQYQGIRIFHKTNLLYCKNKVENEFIYYRPQGTVVYRLVNHAGCW